MTSIVFGVFLIAHGLVHVAFLAPNPPGAEDYPFDMSRSWASDMIPIETLAVVGRTAAIIATLSFVAAGLGLVGMPPFAGLWRVAAILGVVTSIDVMTAFWSRWFVLGVVIDVAILLAAVAGWPS